MLKLIITGKNLFLSVVLCILLVSCRTTGDVKEAGEPDTAGADEVFSRIMDAPDADDYIVELINSHRLVFISENHSIVNPILFLSENLEKFYNAGTRYLFLEGGMSIVPDSENYNFFMFYPWNHTGWKYESVLLTQTVTALNQSVPVSEQLHVIYAEAQGDNPYPSDQAQMPAFINKRDIIAADCITSVMDQADPEDKAIVFYGGAHGSRGIYRDYRRDNIPPFEWKPLGAYLSEYYADDYVSLMNRHISMLFQRGFFTEQQFNELEGVKKAVESDFVSDCLGYLPNPNYDAMIIERESVYGTNYQYMPSDENLRYIFKLLKDLESKHETSINGKTFTRFNNRGQYLLCVYYLKLFFSDNFDYSFWKPDSSLMQALNGLELFAFAPGSSPSEKISIDMPGADAVREYHSLMRQSGIDRYLVSGDKRLLAPVIVNMELAAAILPDDIWPLYWKAFAETEQGNYNAALEDWTKLLQNPLSGCMENLPGVYRMAADCADKCGKADEAKNFKAEADELWNEHDLDTSGYQDI